MTADAADPAVCGTCGAVATRAATVTWSVAVEAERRVWTCDRCARDHLRGIEAKLDNSWW
jgi:hypothetical protein